MIESLTKILTSHDVLVWTNGFFCALALRRSRISKLLDNFLPGDNSG